MKNKYYKLLCAVLTVVFCLSLYGCGQAQEPVDDSELPAETSPEDDEQTKPIVGFVTMDLSNPYFSNSVIGAQAVCDDYGYELIVVDGNSDPAKQVSAVEDLINRGAVAIDCRCVDEAAMMDVLQRAIDAGIYVNTYPDLELSTTVQKYDDYDQGYLLGKTACDWINNKLGGSTEVAIMTQPTNASVMVRAEGMRDAIAEFCPDASIVAESEGATPDVAMSATESILMAHPDVRVILGVNDSGALGSYEAVMGAGYDESKLSEFFVGGIDGNDEAVEKVAAGSIYRCTIAGAWTVPDIQYYTMENLLHAVEGTDYDRDCVIEVQAVTADTVEAYQSMATHFFDQSKYD